MPFINFLAELGPSLRIVHRALQSICGQTFCQGASPGCVHELPFTCFPETISVRLGREVFGIFTQSPPLQSLRRTAQLPSKPIWEFLKKG